MIRFYILLGFTFLFMHLHLSGNISKYINMKYSYLSFSAIFVLGLLTLVQMYIWYRQDLQKGKGIAPEGHQDDHKHEHEHEHSRNHDHSHIHDHHVYNHHGHDHSHDEGNLFKRIVVYGIFIVPILSGLLLPVATLDSNIVKAKGFHFPVYDEETDVFAMHQFLRPDTSVFYGADGYRELAEQDFKTFSANDTILLNDDNFLKGMETIYNYPGNFTNKTLQFQGFVFHGEEAQNNRLFLFRFGIVHCVSDSGVFGMLVEFPKHEALKDDDWMRVTGKLSTMYYQPFKMTIPYLKVKSWESIKAPEDPYVYRGS